MMFSRPIAQTNRFNQAGELEVSVPLGDGCWYKLFGVRSAGEVRKCSQALRNLAREQVVERKWHLNRSTGTTRKKM